MNAEKAIRYPVGFHHKHTVAGALIEKEDDGSGTPWSNVEMTSCYQYIDSRKKLYLPLYDMTNTQCFYILAIY